MQVEDSNGEVTNDYEPLVAIYAAKLAAMDKICKLNKDLMFQSDLDRIEVSNIAEPNTRYELTAAVELATAMLPRKS